jgi:hypothetical protein
MPLAWEEAGCFSAEFADGGVQPCLSNAAFCVYRRGCHGMAVGRLFISTFSSSACSCLSSFKLFLIAIITFLISAEQA